MKLSTTSILASLALATTVTASTSAEQIADQLPSCARSCLAEVASSAGCDETDFSCQCTKVPDLDGAASDCFSEGCDSSEIGSKSRGFFFFFFFFFLTYIFLPVVIVFFEFLSRVTFNKAPFSISHLSQGAKKKRRGEHNKPPCQGCLAFKKRKKKRKEKNWSS